MILIVKRWVAASTLGAAFLAGGGAGLVGGRVLSEPPRALAAGPRARPSPPRPDPVPGRHFRVGPNDTLSEISQRAYGTVRRVPDLVAANPGLEPDRLRPGMLLYVPVDSERPADVAAGARPRAVSAGRTPERASIPPPAPNR
jgi:lipoprotein NlpD